MNDIFLAGPGRGSTKDIISVFYKQTDKDPVTEENFVLKLFLGCLSYPAHTKGNKSFHLISITG